MSSAIENAAAAYMAPKVMRGFKFSWLLYGVAAYYGLKYLNKRGILPEQTGAALGFIDRGIDLAKRQIGFGADRNKNVGSQQNQQSFVTH